MMNPGGETQLTDVVREALDEIDRRAVRRGAGRRRHRPRDRVGRQSDHAPHRARHRSDPARHGAVHAGHRRGRSPWPRATSSSTFPNAAVYVAPCIAGHVGADTAAVMLSEGPHRRPPCSCSSTSAPTPRSCWATATRQFAASSPTGPAFEGAQISCGQRATAGAIERVRIDPATLEARSGSSAATCGATSPASPSRRAASASPASAARASSRSIARDVPGRRHRRRRRDRRRRDGRAHAARRRRGPDVQLRACRPRDGELGSHHPERRARHPAGQGRAARRHRAAVRSRRAFSRSTTSGWRARSARTSTRSTPWCWVWCPTAPVEHVRSIGNAAGAGAVHALLSVAARHEMDGRGAPRRSRSRPPPSPRSRSVRGRHGVPPRHCAIAHLAKVVTCRGVGSHPRQRTPTAGAGPTTGNEGGHRRSDPSAGSGTRRTGDQRRPTFGRARRARRTRASHVIDASAVPHAHDAAVRDRQRRGPRRPSSTTPTRSSRRSASRSTTTPRRCRCSPARAPTSTAPRALPRGHVPRDRAGEGAGDLHPARPQPDNSVVQIGGDATVFAPNYGSPFVHDLDRVAATQRSPTSRTS